MIYNLYPPFFIVPEESNFADAWESFCCKMLCLTENTAEIYRRNPPEQGIDLYYPAKQVAYQCKSVESGKSGDFNVSKVIDSIRSAKQAKAPLGWKKYAICTNVNITGTSEKKIKSELPDVILYPRSYWQNLCEKYSHYVERNFRIVLDISSQRLTDTINDGFHPHYSNELKTKLAKDSFNLFLYVNRHDKIYRLRVSPDFEVEDLLDILRSFFKLPESKTIRSERITVSIAHSMVISGEKQTLSKTLREIGVVANSVITYWTTLVWKDEDKSEEFKKDVIHLMRRTDDLLRPQDPRYRAKKAIEGFEKDLHRAFENFDKSLNSTVEE